MNSFASFLESVDRGGVQLGSIKQKKPDKLQGKLGKEEVKGGRRGGRATSIASPP